MVTHHIVTTGPAACCRSFHRLLNRALPKTQSNIMVTHHIVTTGPAVFGRTHCLAPERLRIARLEFNHMLQLGIIRPSSSSWASPLHMVPKRTL